MPISYVSLEEEVRIPDDALNLSGFRRWVHSEDFPERGKVAFIDGEIVVDMSPEEIDSHARLKIDLQSQLWSFVRQRHLGVCYPDGVLLVNEQANVSNEPDLMFCSNASLSAGIVRPREYVVGSGRFVELVGSPDLVVELVSRYSERKDTELLRERYFAAGILEYWLIDARGNDIDFKLLTRGESGFVEAAAEDDGFQASAVLGASFLITRERHEISGFHYTLHDSAT